MNRGTTGRWLVLVAALVVAVATVTACSSDNAVETTADTGTDVETTTDSGTHVETTTDSDSSAEIEGTVTLLGYNPTDAFTAVDELVKESVESQYPGVTVDLQYTDITALEQRLTADLAAGDPPDMIAYFPGPDFVRWASEGLLLDFSELVTNDPELAGVLEVWEKNVPASGYKYEGKVHGITTTLAPFSVWYWEDMLADVGITEYPQTIDELFAAIAALREAGIEPMASGYATPSIWGIDYTFNMLLSNYQEDGVSIGRLGDTGVLGYDDPRFLEAIETFNALHEAGLWNDALLEQDYDPGAKNALADRDVSMFWSSGPWMSGAVPEDQLDNLGIARFPTLDGTSILLNGCDRCFVAFEVSERQQTAEHKELMSAVAKAYLSPEAQSLYAEFGVFPADPSAVGEPNTDDPWSAVLFEQIDLLAASERVEDYATYTPEIYEAVTNGIQSMLFGRSTPEEVQQGLIDAQQTAYGSG